MVIGALSLTRSQKHFGFAPAAVPCVAGARRQLTLRQSISPCQYVVTVLLGVCHPTGAHRLGEVGPLWHLYGRKTGARV